MKYLMPVMIAGALAGCCCSGKLDYADLQWAPDAFDSGVWTKDAAGVITASKDAAIWSAVDYENFVLDFEYKLDPAANSGVIIYATDVKNWIPGSVEIQLLDDNDKKWAKDAPFLKNSSLYGHLAPLATPAKPAGEWNHMTVIATGISQWTSAKKNPDGSDIPPWLSTPWATIPTKGRVGFQGMHGGAKPYFRNIRIAPAK